MTGEQNHRLLMSENPIEQEKSRRIFFLHSFSSKLLIQGAENAYLDKNPKELKVEPLEEIKKGNFGKK